MIVEVRGTGFNNKGAELMLASIVDRLGRTMPDVRLAVDTSTGPFEKRARYGLRQKLDLKNHCHGGWLVRHLFRKRRRELYGLVTADQIDAVLDASGFSLGDAWDPKTVENVANAFSAWRAQQKKIILLPQAFGPFENQRIRRAAQQAMDSAHLVFARDPVSLRHASDLVPKHPALFQAPDFTNLLECETEQDLGRNEHLAAIVPNSKMLTHGPAHTKTHYVKFMAGCIEHLVARGCEPRLVLHDARMDEAIAADILEHTSQRPQIVRESCPIALKRIIGRCHITIGSRFHGLVNALSQGVPSIGTTWSHKYRHLFADYDRPNWLVDSLEDSSIAFGLIDSILENREAETAHLKLVSQSLKSQSQQMWATVEECLMSDAQLT